MTMVKGILTVRVHALAAISVLYAHCGLEILPLVGLFVSVVLHT